MNTYPLKELREESPTCNLRYNNGVLEQMWEQIWAEWKDVYTTKWHHTTLRIWKPIIIFKEQSA